MQGLGAPAVRVMGKPLGQRIQTHGIDTLRRARCADAPDVHAVRTDREKQRCTQGTPGRDRLGRVPILLVYHAEGGRPVGLGNLGEGGKRNATLACIPGQDVRKAIIAVERFGAIADRLQTALDGL